MRRFVFTGHRALELCGALLLSLSACGPAAAPPVPTLNVTAIYTAAFQTLTAQQATQSASAQPTASPSMTPARLVPNTGAMNSVPAAGGATAPAGGTQACDNAMYVSDVTVPDGTIVAPRQSLTKTWAVLNTGSCTWTPSYKLVFLSGESMNGTSVPVPATVSSGESVNLSVNLTAPEIAGNYTGTWRLQNTAGAYFGNILTVVITVSGTGAGGAAPTQAPAATSGP